MGRTFAQSAPSSRAASQAAQAASFRISSLLATRADQSNTAIQQIKLANLQAASNRKNPLSAVERLKQFSQPLPSQVAAQKAQATAESDFLANIQTALSKQLQTAETDFSSRIQSAISKQLSSFTIPQAQAQTPMIESESQIKQEFQSPVSLIPIAIIGIILGAVLLGKN